MSSLISASLSLLSSAVPMSGSLEDGTPPSTSAVLSQAALSVPRTLLNRLKGGTAHPEWAVHEEVIFNAFNIVATHSEAASRTYRSVIPHLVEMQACLCSERITPIATETTDGEIKGYWIGKPVDYATDITLVYIHGGSFITGHPLQSCHALADLLHVMKRENGLNARIFSVEYPLAPEAPYPAGLDACVRTVRWLIDAVGAQNIVVMGDSAGGNLALTTLLRLRDQHPHASYLHKILGCVPISPFVDFLGPRSTHNAGRPASSREEATDTEPQEDAELFGTTTDHLGLNAGRCAVRYYLGTKGLRWYKGPAGWPNPWAKSQWDYGWLKDWDVILGLAPKQPTASSTIRSSSTDSLCRSVPTSSYLAEAPASRRGDPYVHRGRAFSSNLSGLSNEVFANSETKRSSSPTPGAGDAEADKPEHDTPAAVALRPRSIMAASRSASSKRLSWAVDELIQDEEEIRTGLPPQKIHSRQSSSEVDLDDRPDSGVYTRSPRDSRTGPRASVKRYSFVADRTISVSPTSASASGDAAFSGVPFPGLSSLSSPYYLNPELSNYDLERVFLTLALSPYVSPYRTRTFDNLPPLLFMVGQKDLLYGDVMKCVRKAKRTVASAEARMTPEQKAARPKGFGKVDVVEKPLGVHVYLLLPEILVRGKGMEGLRDIAGWVDNVYKERKVETLGAGRTA